MTMYESITGVVIAVVVHSVTKHSSCRVYGSYVRESKFEPGYWSDCLDSFLKSSRGGRKTSRKMFSSSGPVSSMCSSFGGT